MKNDAHRQTVRNISQAERWGSMAAGAAMAIYGLSRRRGSGWTLAAFGALLFRRGATGHCYTYELMGISTAQRKAEGRRLKAEV